MKNRVSDATTQNAPGIEQERIELLSREERIRRNQRAIAVLASFDAGDVDDERASFESLVRGLDDERLDGFKLFEHR